MPGTDSSSGGIPGGGDSASVPGGRDAGTGGIGGGFPGGDFPGGGSSTSGGGDRSLDTLPGSGQGGGVMTASERARVLDGQLRRGYEVFDGMILDERRQTQTQTDGALGGSGGLPGGGSYESGSGNGDGTGAGQASSMPGGVASGPTGGTQSGAPTASSNSGGSQGETFPPPEDIPSGRDDDVVARQIREAAIREPDPELREALWDEYRRYTGISAQE